MKLHVALLPLILVCSAASAGVVTGKIVRQSDKGVEPIAFTAVRLSILDSRREISGAETRSDRSGSYRFPGLEIRPAYRYRVHASVKGVPFSTDPVRPKEASGKLSMPDLTTESTTGDLKDVVAEEAIILDVGRTNVIRVTESYRFINRGSVAYDSRTDGATPLDLPLLRGGFRLEYAHGVSPDTASVTSTQDRLSIQLRIPAGSNNDQRVEFTYLYPYDKRKVTAEFRLPVQRERVHLLLREKDRHIESAQLTKKSTPTLEGVTYYAYAGGPVPAGETLRFTVGGLPLPNDQGNWTLGVGVFLIALFSLAVLLRKAPPLVSNVKSNRKDECIDAMCDLESAYRNGSIDFDDYQDHRARWLEELTNASRGSGSGPEA